MSEPEDREVRIFVPSGVVPPARLRFERPMDAWVTRERRRIRGLPADERLVVLPGTWATRVGEGNGD